MTRLAHRMLAAALLAGACSGEQAAGLMPSGSGGAASGGAGGTGAIGGESGGGGAGGIGATGGTGAIGGMSSATGGMSAIGGMSSASGGDGGGAGDPDDAGMNEDAAGPLYENECTPEVPWECRVCDEQVTCDAPTYQDNGDGTVSSSCCGLVWQRDTEWVIDPANEFDGCRDRTGAAGCYAWQAALDYCASLALAGGGWRVPEPIELESLILRDRAVSPYIDTAAFPNAALWDEYWSSMTGADSVNEAWTAGYGGTPAALRQKTTEHFVRCVKSE